MVLTGGTAFGQGLLVLSSPLLTRIYSPSDFGLLAAYTAILSIALSIAGLRYEAAIPLPEDEDTALHLVVLALGFVVCTCALTAVAVGTFGAALSLRLGAPQLQRYLWLLPVSLLGAGAYQVLTYWAIRIQKFGRIASTQLFQSAAQVVTQVLLGVVTGGPLGLLAGDAVGRVAGSERLAALLSTRRRALRGATSALRLRQVAYRYRQFPLLAGSSAAINSAGLQLPAIVIAVLYGPEAAGWFALGLRVVGLPLRFVGRSVSQVYLGEAAKLAQSSPAALRPLFRRTAATLGLIGLPLIVVLAAFGPWLFAMAFGSQWGQAGEFARALSVASVAQFVATPLGNTLMVLERQGWQLAWDITRLVVSVGAIGLAKLLSLPIAHAIMLYGACMAVVYLLLLCVSALVLGTHAKQIAADG